MGYQVLFESGEESGQVPGLGILKGRVVRFSESELKVPHMGWNSVALTDPADPIWKGMGKEPYFYFVHSYYPQPEDESLIAAFCTYGVRFAAAVRHGNLVATQFHPEKSQKLGVKLLKNFISCEPEIAGSQTAALFPDSKGQGGAVNQMKRHSRKAALLKRRRD